MLLPRGAGDVRCGGAPTAVPSGQRSTYPHQTPPTTEGTQAVSSQRSRTSVDNHAFLLSKDPTTPGCDLIGCSPSYSSPFPTCNDGTARSPEHPKRPTLKNRPLRQVAAPSSV